MQEMTTSGDATGYRKVFRVSDGALASEAPRNMRVRVAHGDHAGTCRIVRLMRVADIVAGALLISTRDERPLRPLGPSRATR